MKISVIVPYEGYYQYLKDCLESLSEQENVEIETLLVGSQDDQKFQQLVDTYKDKISLNVIPCSIEEGVAKKRNLGLENATGDYIYFIDSDDYIMPQTLSCLLQDAMQKDLDLVVGRRWITWFKKQVFETMGDEKNEELNLKYYMLYTGKIENLKAQEFKIKSQVIPVQKVKDKIEELDKKEQKLQNSISVEEREEYSDANIS